MSYKNIIKILGKGGIGVIPTDTIYGLIGRAFSKRAVERIYKVRKREGKKPFIILISSMGDLKKFGIKPNERHFELLKKIWPGPVSIIFPCGNRRFKYLHRGTNSLAFRLPKDRTLRNLIKKAGPLVAPSANLSGKKPATTINEAKKYFGKKVDFYFDKAKLKGLPSTIIEIKR